MRSERPKHARCVYISFIFLVLLVHAVGSLPAPLSLPLLVHRKKLRVQNRRVQLYTGSSIWIQKPLLHQVLSGHDPLFQELHEDQTRQLVHLPLERSVAGRVQHARALRVVVDVVQPPQGAAEAPQPQVVSSVALINFRVNLSHRLRHAVDGGLVVQLESN